MEGIVHVTSFCGTAIDTLIPGRNYGDFISFKEAFQEIISVFMVKGRLGQYYRPIKTFTSSKQTALSS